MRVYAICRNCAEVHPAEMECPACAIGALPAPRPVVIRSRRAPDQEPPSFAADAALSRRGVVRASTVVVSAYVVAVVVLLLAVFAQA